LILLLTNLFIAFLGIGLVIPVLPTIMNELGLSGKMVGYLVAAFAVSQLLISPLAGKWVDRFGRKPMIIMGLLIFSFRSEEHTSELQSRFDIVCRLLLEKKYKTY